MTMAIDARKKSTTIEGVQKSLPTTRDEVTALNNASYRKFGAQMTYIFRLFNMSTSNNL